MIKWSKTKKIIINILIVLGVIAVFSAMLAPLIVNVDSIQAIIPVQIGQLSLAAGFYLIFILTIISSIGFIYTSGYLDKNIENYIVLPINRRDFIIAKLAFIYYNIIVLVGLVAIPFTIVYFVFGKVTVAGVISLILYLLTMPVLVICVVSALLGTVLYFVNKVKNKALARSVLYAIFFVVVFGLYMAFVLSISSISEEGDLTAMIVMVTDLFDKIGMFFFYVNWNVDLLLEAKYFNIIYILLTMVICMGLLKYFELVYYKGSIGFNEGASKSKRRRKKEAGVSTRSVTSWFFIREAKELTKTGAYFFNTIFGNILIVVVYLGMMGYTYFTNDIPDELFDFIKTNLDANMMILITMVIGTFFAIFNNGAATVFSRDAHIIEFLNTLPINQSRAFFGKVLFHTIVEFLTLFIFMMIPMLFLKIDPLLIFVAITTMSLIVAGTIFIPVCIDLVFPTLNWESETALVKRSKSIWMNMIATLILNATVFGLGAFLLFFVEIDYSIVSYILIIFYIVLFIVLLLTYRKLVVRAFRKVK